MKLCPPRDDETEPEPEADRANCDGSGGMEFEETPCPVCGGSEKVR